MERQGGNVGRSVTMDGAAAAARRESDVTWWGMHEGGSSWRGGGSNPGIATFKGMNDEDKGGAACAGAQHPRIDPDDITAQVHTHNVAFELKNGSENAWKMDAEKAAAAAATFQHTTVKPEKPESKEKDRLRMGGTINNAPKAPEATKERHKRDRDGNVIVKSERDEDAAGMPVDEVDAERKTVVNPEDKMDVDRKEGLEHRVKHEDEGHAEEGEKEKDAVIVQQRRRQLRAGPHRETRSKFRSKLREGRLESNFVTYKVGEGLDLVKLWKEHAETASSTSGPTLEVRIPAESATTSNKQVRGSQLWGTDIYTDDSDLVAVLWHTGYYSPTGSPPPACIQELRASLRILAPQTSYKSCLRNSIRSRAWGAASGCSYSIEKCCIVKNGGGIVELEPSLNRTPVVAPTLAPAAMERTMTTRAASSNAHRQQRFIQEVTIQYNLCNEPWLKYSMSIVADRGLKKSQYTSARLKKGDVLYLETHSHRYELAYDGDKAMGNGTTVGVTTATSVPSQATTSSKHQNNGDKNGDVAAAEHYKWSRCNFPLPISAVKVKGVPLPPDCVQVLDNELLWDEVQWSPTGVWIRGKEYALARAQFLTPNVQEAAT